jgi:hypothetical protein
MSSTYIAGLYNTYHIILSNFLNKTDFYNHGSLVTLLYTSNTELKTENTNTIILSYSKKAKYYTLHIPLAANQV